MVAATVHRAMWQMIGVLAELERSLISEARKVIRMFRSLGCAMAGREGLKASQYVMVEEPDLEQVESFSARIADAIRREMGAQYHYPLTPWQPATM